MKENLEKILYQKFEYFSLEEDKEEKDRLRLEIENLLVKENDLDSNHYHIWGLIYYFTTGNLEENIGIAIEKFTKAIKIDARNFLAQLYLAHCYHDLDKLDKALVEYLKVDESPLKDFQYWRYVKLIEQIGYCKYKLGDEEEGEKYFKSVLDYYKTDESEFTLARPSEMLSCLPPEHPYIVEIKEIETYLK